LIRERKGGVACDLADGFVAALDNRDIRIQQAHFEIAYRDAVRIGAKICSINVDGPAGSRQVRAGNLPRTAIGVVQDKI